MPHDPEDPLMPHGGYENLRSYAVAEAVYDATVVFCDRFIDITSRTHDQMIQAARSGVRNISEGSGAAATSKKMEMKLTNVARASLNDELARDYKSFLIHHGLRVWPKNSRQCLAMRERLKHDIFPNLPAAPRSKIVLTGLAGLADFVSQAEPVAPSATVSSFMRHRLSPATPVSPLSVSFSMSHCGGFFFAAFCIDAEERPGLRFCSRAQSVRLSMRHKPRPSSRESVPTVATTAVHTMIRFIAILIGAGLVSAVQVPAFAAKKKGASKKSAAEDKAAASAIDFVATVGPQMNETVLSPLDAKLNKDVRPDLLLLRNDLLDEAKASPVASPDAYQAAIRLADLWLAALNERESRRGTLGGTAPPSTDLSGSKKTTLHYRRDILTFRREKNEAKAAKAKGKKTQAFFDDASRNNWRLRADVLRPGMERQYSAFRELLRQTRTEKGSPK